MKHAVNTTTLKKMAEELRMRISLSESSQHPRLEPGDESAMSDEDGPIEIFRGPQLWQTEEVLR
jgi:hypothetical protein